MSMRPGCHCGHRGPKSSKGGMEPTPEAESRRPHRGLHLPDLKLLVIVLHADAPWKKVPAAARAPPWGEKKRETPVHVAESRRKLGPDMPTRSLQ